MKRLLFALALTLTFASSATAAPIYFGAAFSGANEFPMNASPGTGFVLVGIDFEAHMMSIDATFSGLLGNAIAAHIHCCASPGSNAGVASQLPSFLGFPLGVRSGSYSATFNMALASSFNPAYINNNGGSPASAEAALFAGIVSGRAYFNIHSSQFPGGELRANLAPVPEPATMGLILTGLCAAAIGRRRARRRKNRLI